MNASIGLYIFNENYRHLRFVTKPVMLPTCGVNLRLPVGVTQSSLFEPMRRDSMPKENC